MTTLIVARHGNTFEDGEEPRRIGARTDLPLTEKGCAQAIALGDYLREHDLIPDVVYCSELQRTKTTAALAFPQINPRIDAAFNEIDYGPDENLPESTVLARIGASAIQTWEEQSIVPNGWQVNPAAIVEQWRNFATIITRDYAQGMVLVVTSNGIARFAPQLAVSCMPNPPSFKLGTGALGILRFMQGNWRIDGWNIRP